MYRASAANNELFNFYSFRTAVLEKFLIHQPLFRRVRHNLAKHFSDVAINLGFQGNSRYANDQALVVACFVSLLSDAEAEVRAAAVGHFARMVHWGGSSLFSSYLPSSTFSRIRASVRVFPSLTVELAPAPEPG